MNRELSKQAEFDLNRAMNSASCLRSAGVSQFVSVQIWASRLPGTDP